MHIPYVQQSPQKIYYFRIGIPTDLRRIIGREYIRRTLRTTDANTAFIRAQYLLAHVRRQFDELRSSSMYADYYKMAVDASRHEIKFDALRIVEPGRTIELKNVETDPNRPEEFEWLKTLIQPQAAAPDAAPVVAATPVQRLSAFIDPFLVVKKISGRSERYALAIKDAVHNFIEYAGDIDPTALTEQHALDFAESFATWPSNRQKKQRYKEKTIHEILKLTIPEEDRISVTTYNNNLRKLSTFWIWLRKKGHVKIANPFSELFKPGPPPRDQWDAFSRADIQHILSTKHLIIDAKQPSRYWLPMILAHSGARIEEICALYKEDVERDPGTGIWHLKIQANKPDKHIKNTQSYRNVPIHSYLESIGFLTYVQSVPNGARLFPDLTYKANFGYHEKISRYFSRYLTNVELPVAADEKKTLKSFRHSVQTELFNMGAATEIVDEIVGHAADPKSQSASRYHKGFFLQNKKDALEKINWNLS